MIKKRASKKLLAGLGASIAFSTTAFVSGLGVKAIINNVNNDAQELRFNHINEANFNQIPNLSTPTRDMFLDTTRLGNFHAGTVRKGQTLTPWGWLGLYTENNQASSNSRPLHQKLALTAWNGEILWTNDEYQGQSFVDNKTDIFDIKYDWNTNLIFLARSGNPNGLFKPQQTTVVGENSLIIDVLDAQTGTRLQRIENNSGSTNDLHDFAWKSFFALRANFFDVNNEIDRIEDLYSFDVTSKKAEQALAFYMPNFMQLYQKSTTTKIKQGTLPNFAKVLEFFKILTRGWIFDRTSSGTTFKTRLVDPLKSNEINNQNWSFTDPTTSQTTNLDTSDFYLLANPFWTATNQNDQFVLHFIVANEAGDVYHKIIGFELNNTSEQNNQPLAQFDKTEKIASAGNSANDILNIKLKSNQWGNNAASWNLEFINANLRINKNIFDNNIMTFAIPVAASQNNNGQKNFPIFDVVQLKINDQGLIDSTNSNGKLSSRVFDLGNQILNANNVNNINPWPDTTHSSVNHNYNRLISVSPFDNTFIYNAMPNLQGVNTGVYNAGDIKNKFFNYWLVNAQTGKYKPFVISNDSGLNGTLDSTMIKVQDFLKQGFTFDLQSLDSNNSINLYFNHSGSSRNDWYDSPNVEGVGMRSAKIGLLDDVLGSSANWMSNITDSVNSGTNKLIQVSANSFTTLIHSRADMTKWYARTQFNFDKPGNLWNANDQINKPDNVSTRVKATVFNNKIPDSKVSQQDGVDLVSHWDVGQGKYNNSTTAKSNYDRLIVKRPLIKVGTTSSQEVLPIVTSYEIKPTISSKYETFFNLDTSSKSRLIFKTDQEIRNASWQIFSSWSQDAKMTNHATSSDNISAFTSSLTTVSGQPEWFDARKQPINGNSNLFGNIHNAITPRTTNSNNFSLRTMLQIVKPNNAPNWLNRLNQSFFNPYPISGSEYGNETTFQEVLTNLIAQKARNIDLSEDQENSASGLANLTIKVFLQVSPKVANSNVGNNPSLYKKGKQQILLLDNGGEAIIYDDQYTGERIIYDQSALTYDQMSNYGYGTNIQSKLTASFQSPPSANTKLLINVNFNDLTSTLLRKSASSNDAVFSVEYEDAARNNLVIKPANNNDQEWFKNRFSSFNKMLNLFPVFEYQSKIDDPSNPWKPIDSSGVKLWTDTELKNNLTANNNKLILPTDKKDIKRIRVRLVTKTTNGVPNGTATNDFIKWENWNENSDKLVSSVHTIDPQKITIDNNWFNQTILSLIDNNATLDQLRSTDIDRYEKEIKNLFNATNGNSDELFNQIEIKYDFETTTGLDANALATTITSALNNSNRADRGFFTIGDGTMGSIKVKVYFELKTSAQGDFVLVNPQGNSISNETERSGEIKTNIQTKIDLSNYFDQLLNNPLQAVKGAQSGQLSSFNMPNADSGALSGLSYEKINQIFNPLGLTFQFKQNENNNWSGWIQKEQVQNYNPQDPAIMIGLNIASGAKIKVLVNQDVVDDNYSGIKAKLNLPKLVKLPVNEQQMIEAYNQLNIFSGNTFELIITDAASGLDIVANALIDASATVDSRPEYEELKNNNNLILKFKLGTTDWLEDEELKDYLLKQQNDQNFNDLKMKVELSNSASTQFILDPLLVKKEFNLLSNDNEIIKKWIHGKTYENALKNTNAITLKPGSNKNNLQYNYHNDLQELFNSSGREGLVVQWRLGTETDNDWKNLKGSTNPLPATVPASENEILIRIARDQTNNIYLYGPEDKGTRQQFQLDISQIPIPIQIDSTWLEANPFVINVTDSKNITPAMIQTWEDKIWQKIPEASIPEIKQKMIIKYDFLNHNGLTAVNLFNVINAELGKFDNPEHHGIVKLHDKNVLGAVNGYQIKAIFEKTTPGDLTIQFIDQNSNNIDGDDNKDARSGIVDTSNITTTLNLTDWIQNLLNEKTKVITDNGPGTIRTLTPPVLNQPAGNALFAQQTFSDAEKWLKKAGVNFWWTKESTGSQGWYNTNTINEYDATKGQLWFALQNQSSNLILTLGNNLPIGTLNPGNDNKNQPLTINLDAPKLIAVHPTDAGIFKNNFSGNTKYLNVDVQQITNGLQGILQSLGSQFSNAPLTLLVQVGNENFVDYKDLADFLSQKSTDVASGTITVKFAIDQTNPTAADFGIVPGGEDQLSLITDPATIKIFINDQGIFNDLQNQIQLTGNNTNFTINWPNQWNVDPNNGVLNAGNKGHGLRLEFSFANLEQNSNDVGNDFNQQWVAKVPNQYQLDQKKLYIRFQTQPNFVYEKIESHQAGSPITPLQQDYKFSVDLNLQQLIAIDGNWLQQQFSTNTIDLNDINESSFDGYEQLVQQAIVHSPEIKAKIAIRYQFNNQDNLTKKELIQAIEDYQNPSNNENQNFGLLQLWNQVSGQKINAKFVKTDPNDQSYILDITNGNSFTLDLSSVLSTINLTHVLKWLESIKVDVESDGNKPNSIKRLDFGVINANSDPYFNQKTWEQIKTVLENFGIKMQFRSLTTSNIGNENIDWKNDQNELKNYDPKIGKIQIRFIFNNQKAKNIKLKLSDTITVPGTNSQPTAAIDVKLAIKLVFNIKREFIDAFITTQNVITGNTKNLVIDAAAEAQMISNIKADNSKNNPSFANANIYVGYQLGTGQIGAPWKNRTDFLNELSESKTDQKTNAVVFRILIDNTQSGEFEVPNEINTLHQHENPNPGIKIPYYINEGQWESNAEQLMVTGTSSNLIWNFEAIFGNDKVSEKNGSIYLNNAAGPALQVFFTTKIDADYDNPVGSSSNPNEIDKKWVSVKPTSLNAATTILKIKLVAQHDGFIYGPATNPKTAQAHNVNINIKREILVDPAWFTEESLSSTEIEISQFIQQKDILTRWENQVYEKIARQNNVSLAVAKKIQIKYIYDNGSERFLADDLLNYLEQLRTNFNQPKLGIIQLWNKNQGDKISAVFVSGDQEFVLKTNNSNTPTENDLREVIDTSKIYTSISLIDYIKVLKNKKTTVESKINGKPGEINDFEPPAMSGQIGAGFLQGFSFEEITNRLNEVGVQVKFAKTAATSDQDWLPKEQITSYDIQTSALFLSFEIEANAKNIKVQWDTTKTLEPGQSIRGNDAIKLPLDVPKYIIIDTSSSAWLDIKQKFNFSGNTKNIEFNQSEIDNFINKILEENYVNSGDVDYQNAPLKIEFQVSNESFTEISQLKNYLSNLPDDLPGRDIRFKFSIPNESGQIWKLVNPNDEYTLLTENDSEINKIKIYINDKNIFNDLKDKTELSGTNQLLQWTFWKDLTVDPTNGILKANNRGQGLKVEFTFNTSINDDALTGTDIDQEWVSQMPTSFKVNQSEILLRLNLIDENRYQYDKMHQRISLDLSAIVVVLNLQSTWLKELILNGDTKNLNIDDNKSQSNLEKVLPPNKPNLVKIKYTVNGRDWYEKDNFIQFLKTQEGKKDEFNFILKRSEIQARFELDQTENKKFQMTIDGQIINPDNSNSPKMQLINDQVGSELNSNVQGYIELNNLKYFLIENFAIKGTNTSPQLIINKKQELETLMQVYATDQFFDILITSQKNPDGSWDFSNQISLLTTKNTFINDAELIKKGFVLGADKQVALKFKSKDSKYDVYKQGTKYVDGYNLDISQNVEITFEIENPFVKQNKTLALWWTADQKKTEGKYYQGQGGFKVVNGDQAGNPDLINYQSSLAWLQSTQSGLSAKEQETLEFVYYVYEGKPDEATINQVEKDITNYDSQWKKLNDVLNPDKSDFTNPLGLKVGQYVSVALRVKQEYATGDDVYTLKNNQHSFISPISANGQTDLGRAHGYKISADALKINEEEISLENMLNSEQAPLDGYTNIKRLALVKDENENYQGADLELQLFHQFYKGQNQEEVLITPFDKVKLIKREQNNIAPNDYFKNADGQYIQDETGNPIPILLDANGRPQPPKETASATFSEKFTRYGEGFFGMTIPLNDSKAQEKWGIFKNESIKIVFKAYEGSGGTNNPDFILDKPKMVDLKDFISPKIKFPILNQNNIKYEFNQNDFSKENVEFESSTPDQKVPIDGKSKVKTLIKLTKTTNTNPDGETIEGQTAEEAVMNLQNELKTSFQNKLQFETTYEKSDGGIDVQPGLTLYKLAALKNNDRIKVRIISTDSDFIWAEPLKALTINVNGLTAKAPNPNKLQFLRVEQSGQINGKGAFKVLIDNPNDPNSNAADLLDGWKFVIRVWDKQKEIKHQWTDDQSKITNLKNGDKIEWKLVDQFNNPVSDPYYNTIAGEHEFSSDGSIKLIFNEVNYSEGANSLEIVNPSIGQYPSDPDAYPENSGFVISGLKEKFEIFEISETNFTKVINKLEPHYVGVNGQGRINFNATYLDNNYYVNTDGELYEKPTNRLANQQLKVEANEVKEISLDEFLANVTFYTSDPNLVGYQNGFKFVDNETNIDNQLHNGDEIWAQFDLLANNNEINQGVNVALGPVSGLQEVVTDQMSTLWYVMMALGGIVTLGGLTALVALLRRHKKIKR